MEMFGPSDLAEFWYACRSWPPEHKLPWHRPCSTTPFDRPCSTTPWPPLFDHSLTPLGGPEVTYGDRFVRDTRDTIRDTNVIESHFLETKTKLLLFASPTKGLMGSTWSGPWKPLLGCPKWFWSAGSDLCFGHTQEGFPRSGSGGSHETFCWGGKKE